MPRGVAQSGSAPGWGPGGRRFKSCLPDVESLPHRAETEGAFHGIEGMERFWADTQEVFEKFELHYELLDLGERVLAWGEIHLRARGSGIETDIPFGGLVEFLDGKIVR